MTVFARTDRRKLRSEESRRDILEAAIRVLSEKGMSGVTMRQIAEEAKISDGAIFFHFGSREGLFLAVVEEVKRLVAERVTPALSRTELSPDERAVNAIDALIESVRENLQVFRVASFLSMETAIMPGVAEAFWAGFDERRDHFSRPIRQAIALGRARAIDVPSFIDFLYAALQGAVLQRRVRPEAHDIEPLLAMIREAALGLLGLDSASATSAGGAGRAS